MSFCCLSSNDEFETRMKKKKTKQIAIINNSRILNEFICMAYGGNCYLYLEVFDIY